MPRIVFVEPDGNVREVAARNGMSLMEAAVADGIAGIEAECGGACACATCHVYVDAADAHGMDLPSGFERGMLESALDLRPTSRLSCQIRVSEALDGLTVSVPRRQGV